MSTTLSAKQATINRGFMEALSPSTTVSSTCAANIEMSMPTVICGPSRNIHATVSKRSESMSVSIMSEKNTFEQSPIQTYRRDDWRCLRSRFFASSCTARCRGCRLAKKLKSTYKCFFRRRKILSKPKEEQQPQKALPMYKIVNFTPVSSVLSLPEIFLSIEKHTETEERLNEAARAIVNEMDDELRETIMATPLLEVKTAPSVWALATPPPRRTERHESAGHFGSYANPLSNRLPVRAHTRPPRPIREPSRTPNELKYCPSFYWKKGSPCPSRAASMPASETRNELPAHLDTPEQQAKYESLVSMAQNVQLSPPPSSVDNLQGNFELSVSVDGHAKREKRRDSKNKANPGSSTERT